MNAPGGTITIAGKTVSRLGLGTMRLGGRESWGLPTERATLMTVLIKAIRTHGITHIDTADAYGPHTVEDLIHDSLSPYWFDTDVLIATKVGMIRTGPQTWLPHGHPNYLRAAVEGSLRRLGVERLELCYLHRNDPAVPFLDQVGALAELQTEGKIAHIGLSKVGPAEIDRARQVIEVAAVQNKLNQGLPDDLATVEHCGTLRIPYVAYTPLGAGTLAAHGGAGKALRWLLDLGPHVAAIPGTSSVRHLDELVYALQPEAA
ncbi:aldo/keto reductase [Streptomyces erythrochromogenes]|uniref:aldo/keto reductase n=1 Tax=Streptomyces erythrochromogenes TaxID=285574 RepID=UPI0036F72774